jgi:hypothetical protein
MNDDVIVPIFVVIDDVMRALIASKRATSEVLTVAVVAACQFQNHQQRALEVMRTGLPLRLPQRLTLQSAVARPR